MNVPADSIASLVLQTFDQLPAKRKPLVRSNGVHEWVPLSGIVAQGGDSKLHCLSLATGMKCLPSSKLPLAQGNVLHDWHAEVLAIRAFNRFVLDEACSLAQGTVSSSAFLRRREESELHCPATRSGGGSSSGTPWHGQAFVWREDVKLHMYCSEAPCGDASMELTMASQDDASPWAVPTSSPDSSPGPVLPGRAYFSQLGLVRRKPARGDAPPTLSKSCSDKLSLHQCTSLLSSLTSLFVCPGNVYIHSLVLPASQYSESSCRRAFSAEEGARMAGLKGREWYGGYKFKPFEVGSTEVEFAWSKRSVGCKIGGDKGKMAASNLALAWTKTGLEEATMGGTIQGRKALDPKGASVLSRRKMWALAVQVAGLLGVGLVEVQKALAANDYKEVKDSVLLEARKRVKGDVTAVALKGWLKNDGDGDFSL